MKIFLKIFLVLLSFYGIDTYAQVTQQWVRRYDGGSGGAKKVLVDKSTGDVYVAGRVHVTGSGYDFVTIKYNSAGVLQWLKKYNDGGWEEPADMILDNLGNIIITGYTVSSIGNSDYITVKYDSFGNRLWVKRYNGTANSTDIPASMDVDISGGIIITGYSKGNNSGIISDDIVTIKYDYFGNTEWVQRFNGSISFNDRPYSLIIDSYSNVYITGYANGTAANTDFVTIKYSPQGSIEWVRYFQNSLNDVGYKILKNDQREEIYSIGKNGSNTIMLCYDFNGNLKWQTSDYGAISGFSSAIVDNSGNIFLCGTTIVNGTIDYGIIIYNSLGNVAGFNSHNSIGSDYPNAISIDNSNNIYISGSSQVSGAGSSYLTVKFSRLGAMLWEKRYNHTGTGVNEASSVATDNSGNLYVTGFSQTLSGTNGIATIKYSQGLIFGRSTNEIPSKFKLHQNYPNPFNPSTNIKFDIPEDSDVKIAVFDMLGREVHVFADGFKEAGSYEVNFDASQLSSGTYFYKLTTDDFTEIKKMVIIK